MKTIWKYELPFAQRHVYEMPRGATPLCVQTQRGIPCLWMQVDNDQPREMRAVQTIGTGYPADSVVDAIYAGTYQLHDEGLVFHVFVDRAGQAEMDATIADDPSVEA
jgi:hypothetical protein